MKRNLIILSIILFQLPIFSQNDYQRIKVSDDIELIKLSDKAYVHVSVAEIGSFGKVSSNGLILIDKGEAFLFDTPVTNMQTEVLANWIADSLHAAITTFIPNHWHEDCIGGLDYLHSKGVKSYANEMTIDIARAKGLPLAQYGFKDSLSLKMNDIDVLCYYLGAGHTLDNIVVYIPSEKILFSGCMTKDIHSKGLGNTVDGDVHEWAKTIDKVLNKFPEARVVIPGHGEIGGIELLKHTRELLNKK